MGYRRTPAINPGVLGSLDVGAGDVQSYYATSPPQLGSIRQGTAAAPLTTPNPTVKVSRIEQLTRAQIEAIAGVGADGVDLCSALVGINSGTASTEVQPVGVFGAAKTASTVGSGNDACGIYGAGRITGSATGIAIGGFFAGRRDTDTGKATGIEVATANYTATPGTYSTSVSYQTGQGMWIAAPGNSRSAAGIVLGKASGQQQFDVGLAFTVSNPVLSQSIRDDGNAATSLLVSGAHATAAIAVADGAGHVGVGVLAPAYRLDIYDTTVSPQGTLIAARSNSATTRVLIENSATDGDPILQFSLPSVKNWMMGIDDSDSDRLKIQPASTPDWSGSLWVFDTNGVQLGPTVAHGGGVRVIGIANATTDPTSNPSGGGVLYASGGSLRWRGSSGTVTTIAPA